MYNHYPLGKYFYKNLPMVIANYPDIFQQKVNDLFHGFEFICLYIDNILIVKKGDWTDHLQKLELNIYKPKEKLLKCNI